MQALPQVMAGFLIGVIVGDNDKGYAGGHPSGRPLKEVMLAELQGQLNLERIHFRVPHPHLIGILQASWGTYLSYPFILGWSLWRRWLAVVALWGVGACRWKR